MRESRTFGSVGGEGGNALAYPAYIGHTADAVATAAFGPELARDALLAIWLRSKRSSYRDASETNGSPLPCGPDQA